MRAIYRGLRNVYRSKTRAGLVIVLLGLSIGVFITMAQAAERTGQSASRLERTVETLIEVRAAGATGMGRGAEPLGGDVAETIRGIPGIRSVEEYLYFRQAGEGGRVSVVAGLRPIDAQLRVNSHGEVGTPTLLRGRLFGLEDAGRNVAVVGTFYADQGGLDVGSTLTLEGTSLEVIGIFDAGFVFGNNQLFVPLSVTQELAYREVDPRTGTRYIRDREGVSNIFVVVESVGRVREVERLLRERLGDGADVLSGQQNAAIAAEGLARIQSGSLLGALLSLAISALLVLFTMALITRERVREIGVLKALGASNLTVIRQFVAEAVAMSTAGAVLGMALFAVGAPFIADRLLLLSSTSLTVFGTGMGSQPAADVVTFSVSAAYWGYAAALAIGLGVLGSLYPAYSAARMRPADALRHE